MAHELRQPLSTIESIAYYLEMALPDADDRVREQLTRLRHLAEQSGWILNDSMSLLMNVEAQPEAVDVDELVSEFVLEQMQHDSKRPRFELELGGSPVWMDYQSCRELVDAKCRLFRTLAQPGADVWVSSRQLSSGGVVLRTRTKGAAGDDAGLPPGTQLTLDRIAMLVAQAGATMATRLEDPEQLEMVIELQGACLDLDTLPESEPVRASFAEAGQSEQVAPGIL